MPHCYHCGYIVSPGLTPQNHRNGKTPKKISRKTPMTVMLSVFQKHVSQNKILVNFPFVNILFTYQND